MSHWDMVSANAVLSWASSAWSWGWLGGRLLHCPALICHQNVIHTVLSWTGRSRHDSSGSQEVCTSGFSLWAVWMCPCAGHILLPGLGKSTLPAFPRWGIASHLGHMVLNCQWIFPKWRHGVNRCPIKSFAWTWRASVSTVVSSWVYYSSLLTEIRGSFSSWLAALCSSVLWAVQPLLFHLIFFRLCVRRKKKSWHLVQCDGKTQG